MSVRFVYAPNGPNSSVVLPAHSTYLRLNSRDIRCKNVLPLRKAAPYSLRDHVCSVKWGDCFASFLQSQRGRTGWDPASEIKDIEGVEARHGDVPRRQFEKQA